MSKYFTIDEYAKASGHHPRYVRALISREKLSSEMISNRRLLPRNETNLNYLAERKRLTEATASH